MANLSREIRRSGKGRNAFAGTYAGERRRRSVKRIICELGKAPTVVLTKHDRLKFKEALKQFNATELAKKIGVSRTHLYALTGSQRMELQRFVQIERHLKLFLLSHKDVEDFLVPFVTNLHFRCGTND